MNKRYFSSLSFLLIVGSIFFSSSKLGAMQKQQPSFTKKITFPQQQQLWHCNRDKSCNFSLRGNKEILNHFGESPTKLYNKINPTKEDLLPEDFLSRFEAVLKEENINCTIQTGALFNYINEEILAEKTKMEKPSKSRSGSKSPQKKQHKKRNSRSSSQERSRSRSRSISKERQQQKKKQHQQESEEQENQIEQQQQQKDIEQYEQYEEQQQQQQQEESEEAETITCALCCEGFEEGEEVLHYDDKCNHPFHLFCLNQLYQREDAAQCPNCLIEQENADN